MSEHATKSMHTACYDLHSHTTASDGLLTPTQLVIRAVKMGVDVLAITDHDTISGIAEAVQAIKEQGLPLHLIYGAEISTLWETLEIHIVGLGIDITQPSITQLFEAQWQRRQLRAQKISEQLMGAGIVDVWQQVQELANGGQLTRAHFARYLIALGRADNTGQAFKKYLLKGTIGYVAPQWDTIEHTIAVIHQAGGQAVLAHPSRYNLSAKQLKKLLAYFAAHGGDAMEVAQCQQSEAERLMLCQYSRHYRLLASQGSDFHQPNAWIELGRNLMLPVDVEPVWRHWGCYQPQN